ncbi:hypothetical protein K439DRAFT_1548406 [Ramaria rubella]|nr:hypothetical protein K439DRAFT_1548406 [Ramaria rubella]
MDSEVAKAITSEFHYIWLKSLVRITDETQDPLDLLKHGWLLQKYEKPPMMMLIQQYGQEMGTEVGFRLQGILVDMKLPPRLKEGVVDEWVASSYQNYPTASFSSQYLSPKSHGDAVAISSLVDPLGLIQKCDDQFVYNKNNVVHYYCRSGPNTEMNAPVLPPRLQNEGGRAVVNRTNLKISLRAGFKPDCSNTSLGHIVELQVVFYLRPSRTKGHWFFDTTLRSISLIDSSIDQALLKIKMDKGDYHKPKFTPPHGLKRVSGIRTLEDQHVENTRKKMHRLKIVEMATYSNEDVRENSMEVEIYSKTGRAE